jgi:hypothetical protein
MPVQAASPKLGAERRMRQSLKGSSVLQVHEQREDLSKARNQPKRLEETALPVPPDGVCAQQRSTVISRLAVSYIAVARYSISDIAGAMHLGHGGSVSCAHA